MAIKVEKKKNKVTKTFIFSCSSHRVKAKRNKVVRRIKKTLFFSFNLSSIMFTKNHQPYSLIWKYNIRKWK